MGEGENHGFSQFLGCLVRATHYDGTEQGLAMGHVGVGLGVMDNTHKHVLGLAWADGSLRHSQAYVGLGECYPRTRTCHRGPFSE